MKVVVASTEEQEEKLQELVSHLYTAIFPHYFSQDEINSYAELDILKIPGDKRHPLYRLDSAFRAIASLEVIISILENHTEQTQNHKRLFEKNVKILEEADLFFPFCLKNFQKRPYHLSKQDYPMAYSKPANCLMI